MYAQSVSLLGTVGKVQPENWGSGSAVSMHLHGVRVFRPRQATEEDAAGHGRTLTPAEQNFSKNAQRGVFSVFRAHLQAACGTENSAVLPAGLEPMGEEVKKQTMTKEGTPTREACMGMIRKRAEAFGRLPKKSDFSDLEVAYIKAYFGPWPRALEAAGVKEPRDFDRIERNREKRARAKERRRAAASARLQIPEAPCVPDTEDSTPVSAFGYCSPPTAGEDHQTMKG